MAACNPAQNSEFHLGLVRCEDPVLVRPHETFHQGQQTQEGYVCVELSELQKWLITEQNTLLAKRESTDKKFVSGAKASTCKARE